MLFLDVFASALKPRYDDDSIDRLNYINTPTLLVILALTLSAKQYFGQPIKCWTPANFTGSWIEYSENYCFAQNTYFVPIDEPIPGNPVERQDKEIGYYQWVPLILGLQAILFYMPALLWRLFNWYSGLAVKPLVRMSRDAGNLRYADTRRRAIKAVAARMHESLRMSKCMQHFSMTPFVHNGSYLTGLYLIFKVLYLVQVAIQFLILNKFFSTNYTFWGIGILNDVLNGRVWEESGHFPRLQCSLTINHFNEKVYLFLWWWLLSVAIATIISLVRWFLTMSNENSKKEFVARLLYAAGILDREDAAMDRPLTAFVNGYLRSDGVFLCKLILLNTGDRFLTDLIAALWRRFLEDEHNKEASPIVTAATPTREKGEEDRELGQDNEENEEMEYEAEQELEERQRAGEGPASNEEEKNEHPRQ